MTRIVFFSDLHYAPELPVNNGSRKDRKLIQYSLPMLEKITDKINNDIKPDVAIYLGDFIEDFNERDKDIISLKFIWKEMQKINVPLYACIGNHDLRSMVSRKDVEQVLGYKHSTFSIDISGLHFVVLGTFVNNELGNEEGGFYKANLISQDDMNWLKEDLEKNTLPTIICIHFGLAEYDMKDNWWFKYLPDTAFLGNRKDLKEILRKNKNVLAVFSGHQHWTKKIIEDEIPYYVVGSMVENINDDGVPDGVYLIVDIDDKKLNVIEEHIRL